MQICSTSSSYTHWQYVLVSTSSLVLILEKVDFNSQNESNSRFGSLSLLLGNLIYKELSFQKLHSLALRSYSEKHVHMHIHCSITSTAFYQILKRLHQQPAICFSNKQHVSLWPAKYPMSHDNPHSSINKSVCVMYVTIRDFSADWCVCCDKSCWGVRYFSAFRISPLTVSVSFPCSTLNYKIANVLQSLKYTDISFKFWLRVLWVSLSF